MELTKLQKEAVKKFNDFIVNPSQHYFVISGFAGTGKTTLVKELVKELPPLLETIRILKNDNFTPEVFFTATTNKAVESLRGTIKDVIEGDVHTIHSTIGLVAEWNSSDNEYRMVKHGSSVVSRHAIVFVDEASYVNEELFDHIKSLVVHERIKVVFIGDPAQLLAPKCDSSPVFDSGFPEARLTEVMRQAKGNPIQDLSTLFREAVYFKQISGIQIDHDRVKHVSGPEFKELILDEFTDPEWDHHRSRILACTNKVVESYNKGIREHITGSREIDQGMVVVANKHTYVRRGSLKNNQSYYVYEAKPHTERINDIAYEGQIVTIEVPKQTSKWSQNHFQIMDVFVPFDPSSTNKALADYSNKALFWSDNQMTSIRFPPEEWADLRAIYASTVHKSQGSTYDKVFIDLDDMKRIRDPSALARLLYVAVSRARHQVIFKGDIR